MLAGEIVHQGRWVQGTGPRLGVEDPIGQGILGRLPHLGIVVEDFQHPLGQGGSHASLPFARSPIAVPGTDRPPCGIEQRMDHALPPTREGEGLELGEPEAHQARHDMQCVQLMLETMQSHGQSTV